MKPPAEFDAQTRALFRQYAERQEEAGGEDPLDRPLLELAAALNRRLIQVRGELDKARADNGDSLRVQTVRGAWTTDPLLGHERELTAELRQIVKALTDRAEARVDRKRGGTQTLDVALGPPARLRMVQS